MSNSIKETVLSIVCGSAVFNFDIDEHYPDVNNDYYPKEPLIVDTPEMDKINLMRDIANVKGYFRNSFEKYKQEKVNVKS